MILLKAVVVSMFLSIGFWLPLLEQMFSQNLKGSGLSDAFRYNSVQGLDSIFINSLNDSITSISRFPTISLVGLILFISLLITYKKNTDTFDKIMLYLTTFLILFSSSLFPWVFFGHTPIGAVQFVGRYLVFTLILIIVLAIRSKAITNSLLIICLLLTFSSTISKQVLPNISNEEALSEYFNGERKNQYEKKYYDLNNIDGLIDGTDQVNGIAGGEYVNEHASIEFPSDLSILINQTEITNLEKSYGKIEFDFTIDSNYDKSEITLPFLWYKWYTATYSEGASGTQPSLNYENDQVTNNGKATIEVHEPGHVEITYKKTIIQMISFTLAILSWLILIFYLFKDKLKNRNA